MVGFGMGNEQLGEIWRSAFSKAGAGENRCLSCGHEVLLWEEGGVWYVRNMNGCEQGLNGCLSIELKIAAHKRGMRIQEV